MLKQYKIYKLFNLVNNVDNSVLCWKVPELQC